MYKAIDKTKTYKNTVHDDPDICVPPHPISPPPPLSPPHVLTHIFETVIAT